MLLPVTGGGPLPAALWPLLLGGGLGLLVGLKACIARREEKEYR